MTRIGFIGLGVMGGPMAGHLLKAGHDVTVWARTPAKAKPLADQGAAIAESLEELAKACDIVILCVTKSEDVHDICSKLAHNMRPDSIIVDHSTISPKAAKDVHDELEKHSIGFIDAPITGGSMGAQKGTLTIFMGGNPTHIHHVLPYVQAYAKRAERVGDSGAGQMMKMVNQIAVGGALIALCEALSFAQKAGLNLEQAREMVGSGAAGSWAFENYGPKILNRDWSPGFSILNQTKDFGYCEEAAREIGAAVPGTELVNRLLQEMIAEGRGQETTCALFEKMLRMPASG
ncbi:MAG: NAD(P)-dependent oxidoreductase [Fimbriimonadaceae bacterium]|nr:NAD(P)-dependent oxidoreductase [Fimbriimonadaceae bacterium]